MSSDPEQSSSERRALIEEMNNFGMYLGLDQTIEEMESGEPIKVPKNPRSIDYKEHVLDKSHRDILLGWGIDIDRNSDWKYSERYLNETPRQFYATIDKVREDLGISREELRRIRDEEGVPALNEAAIPIYQKLLELGYSKRELTE